MITSEEKSESKTITFFSIKDRANKRKTKEMAYQENIDTTVLEYKYVMNRTFFHQM